MNQIFVLDLAKNDTETPEIIKQAKELTVSAHLNLSLVYLKVTPVHHFEAKDHAAQALTYDPNNIKGLFRRGQALLGLGEAEQALRDFQKIVDAEPQNKVGVRGFCETCDFFYAVGQQKSKRLI